MIPLSKCHCPSSEDFFYWPPEEIAHYSNWCEIGNSQHKRRLKHVCTEAKNDNNNASYGCKKEKKQLSDRDVFHNALENAKIAGLIKNLLSSN